MTETEKKAVGRYLDWHTGILLETDGKMGIYRKESGKLIYKEKADSEDGYLGMYLFLMGKYPLYTGEAGWICMECEKLYGLYEKKNKNRIYTVCMILRRTNKLIIKNKRGTAKQRCLFSA